MEEINIYQRELDREYYTDQEYGDYYYQQNAHKGRAVFTSALIGFAADLALALVMPEEYAGLSAAAFLVVTPVLFCTYKERFLRRHRADLKSMLNSASRPLQPKKLTDG